MFEIMINYIFLEYKGIKCIFKNTFKSTIIVKRCYSTRSTSRFIILMWAKTKLTDSGEPFYFYVGPTVTDICAEFHVNAIICYIQ